MLRICIVKQNSSYDLYTRMGPDLRSIVESSNWRSGPIGLWEVFNCDLKIVLENKDRECQIGKKHWSKYVKGWKVWNDDNEAFSVEEIDWSVYDIVIAIDLAVPTRIVKKFRDVMWCYYFIEGGPVGIDTIYRGSPFYGYNVFLNHKLAKNRLDAKSGEVQSIIEKRRTVLDFPYYIQSSKSVKNLYPELVGGKRKGMILSHHSYDVLTEKEMNDLHEFGVVRKNYKTISDIHKLEISSKYFVVHPNSKRTAGLALIEAISAGCLALSPRKKLWGFPELVNDNYEYSSIPELVRVLRRFEETPELYQRERENQSRYVDQWCFYNPVYNLEYLFHSFKRSKCSPDKQYRSEKYAFIRGIGERGVLSLSRKMKTLVQALRSC